MWQVFTPLQSSNQNLAVLGYIVLRVHYEFRGVRTDAESLTIPAKLPLLAPVRFPRDIDEESARSLSKTSSFSNIEDVKQRPGPLMLPAQKQKTSKQYNY